MDSNLKKIKNSLTKKITIGFIIVISIIGMIVFSGYYFYNGKLVKQDQIELADECAKTTAKLLYRAPFEKFLKSGKNDLYKVYFSALYVICENFNIKYLYVYIPNFEKNTVTMIFTLDGVSKENIKDRDLGTVVPWKLTKVERDIFSGRKNNSTTETNNRFGHVITRYSAVYNVQKKPVALVGVDSSVEDVNYRAMNTFLKGLFLIIIGLVSIYGMLILYLKQVFIKPVMLISSKMKNFINENRPGYEPIKLNSEDELASMADSFNKMASDINSYVKKISEMQMETIFSLAKLAQSRDDDTGKHLERVQQYCYVLATKLSQDSPYSHLIDDNFINNIVNASALHDIGKVGVADSILLKPGKLTDEEFAQMKKHTIIGYQTLSEVHSSFGKNTFIEMGMLIAKYHHERFDGKGYPEGLKGEEIPLEARIMSIADVYDALGTKRVYKDAFSQEKCIEIIKEGRATQFDPVIVDVFLQVADTFYKIRQENED